MKLNKTNIIALTAAALIPLASQATIMKDSSTDELTKIVYVCEDNKTLDVVFVNTDKSSYAIMNEMNELIPMQIQQSASGAIYKAINKNYTYELLTKGNTATLMGDNKPILSSCVTE
ncbi:c-type lysozyme inhibitor [Rodentibacter pneumotropicus]|uniref:C-type lysozyme inhibitor n=2 Tax=Rodentibacter pneumotropicus TaxID=758 RepID=A0AAW5LAK7_9PAST|nr:c-type lysozyme inhibitor [Rodentibacter pneumotropicus]MCQ9120632.1 c-type lysozyme inhibitor [Rodentibacter pneumotropicus]NBH75772.1 c-type lysozyme inhibitor [Rodentibacter pneumotropicus]OOF61037.1 lysozyme inhibitor [Rodentibacter pneumotropicus]OOF68799.1 lysozyme inhibitor [Rodentibacter pneumotropicus]THA02092.1 c-type lysozyme inhibitor [Rodentibacter pneumotropicus]